MSLKHRSPQGNSSDFKFEYADGDQIIKGDLVRTAADKNLFYTVGDGYHRNRPEDRDNPKLKIVRGGETKLIRAKKLQLVCRYPCVHHPSHQSLFDFKKVLELGESDESDTSGDAKFASAEGTNSGSSAQGQQFVTREEFVQLKLELDIWKQIVRNMMDREKTKKATMDEIKSVLGKLSVDH